MKLKEGVTLEGAKPELINGLAIADAVYMDIAERELVVTSIKDGKHSTNSLHYKGYAADFRTRDLEDGIAAQIVQELKKMLDKDFDIVLEGDHIHFEYDPH